MSSYDDLWWLRMSQRQLVLFHSVSAASVQGTGQARRTERYVAQPGGRREASGDVEGEVVNLSALQCVAGVVFMGLVPGQDTSFMLWSCWTLTQCVKWLDFNAHKAHVIFWFASGELGNAKVKRVYLRKDVIHSSQCLDLFHLYFKVPYYKWNLFSLVWLQYSS